MDKKQSLRKDLRAAWGRYVNDSYTGEDLELIIHSLRNDDGDIQEFNDVFDSEWEAMMRDLPPASEDRKERYGKEAAQIIAECERKQKALQSARIPLRTANERFRKLFYAAAAAVLLGILIPSIYFYKKHYAEQFIVQYVEAVTRFGEVKTVILPDQTTVTLNAGSRLKYPASFIGDERSVELCGEALFDVVPDARRPFTVKTEQMNVRVLGTVFDVKAYENDMWSMVSVSSGKVEVKLSDGKALLQKNQQLKMDKRTGNFEKLTVEADKYRLWTDGTLYFHRTPICEVVNMLNRHYPQIDIELDSGDYPFLISGEHDNKSFEAALTSIMYMTGLKYKKEGNRYTLSN